MTGSPTLRYLSAPDVAAAMPGIEERLALARTTLEALGRTAEMPAKTGVHPRQPGSLAHAMPALLSGRSESGEQDLIGMKWIAGFPANSGIGLPAYHALVILNDGRTGRPTAVLHGGTITAARTAAVSGVAIELFAPKPTGRPARVALLGAGAQARGHLPLIGSMLSGAAVSIADVDAARVESLAAEAATTEGIGETRRASSVGEAVECADVVVSVVSFGPDHQALDADRLGPETLMVAVDYDMQASAALAHEALFVVDEREQFLATRAAGGFFAGYPDPAGTLGDALRGDLRRPRGRILVSHLGVGLADVVFASAVLKRAEQLGLGRLLPE